MKKILLVILTALITLNSTVCVTAKEAYKLGDVNHDNRISVIDAVCIQRYIVGDYEDNGDLVKLADVDGDKKVNVVDVTYILRYIINIIDHFPAESLTPTIPDIAEDGYYNKIVKP